MAKSTNKALNVNYQAISNYFRLNTIYYYGFNKLLKFKDLCEWQANTITYHSNYGIHT